MKPKNILITGGCGFLGQYLTKDILETFPNTKIKLLDLRENQNPILKFNNSNITTVIGKDICNYDSIKNEFKDIDTVIHLAGIVSFSIKDKQLLENVNINGTKNIIKAVKNNNIKQFLHISSVAALGYNDDKNNPINEEFKFNWDIAEKNKKYYMLTKHLADKEIEKEIKDNNLKATILYPGLMLGPGDYTNTAKLIKAIKDKRMPVNMPGGTNLIDVRDVSKGIINTLKQTNKEHYLLSGHNLTMKEITKTIANEVSVNPPKLTVPKLLNPLLFNLVLLIESLARNKTEVTADNVDSSFKFRYFDNTKAKKELKWEPEISFQKTIKDSVDWMNKNDLFKE